MNPEEVQAMSPAERAAYAERLHELRARLSRRSWQGAPPAQRLAPVVDLAARRARRAEGER